MLRPSFGLTVVLFVSSLAVAQVGKPKKLTTPDARQPVGACAFTFTSGKGRGLTQYCVTQNGNIAQFSSAAGGNLQELLSGVAPAIEGYGLCDLTIAPVVAYWDYSSNASDNWNPATVVATPTSVTVTRTTADGIWQLVQTIIQLQGSAKEPGAARIVTAITNLSVTFRQISYNRHVNIDAGASTFNDFIVTPSTVLGVTPAGGGAGLTSTVSFVTTKFDFSVPLILTAPDGPNPCQIVNGTQQFFEGDGSAEQFFNLTIPAGQTKTVAVTYRPL